MFRFVFVSHEAGPYGATRVLWETVRWMDQEWQPPERLRDNWEVVLIYRCAGPIAAQYRFGPRVRVIRASTRMASPADYAVYVGAAERLLRRLRPHAVLVNTVAALDWLHASCNLGLPTAFYCHERENEVLRFVRGRGDGLCFPPDDRVLSTLLGVPQPGLLVLGASDEVLRDLTGTFGVHPALCALRRPGIDVGRLDGTGDCRANDVCMVGYGTARKGFDLFCRVADRLPDMAFVWVGPQIDFLGTPLGPPANAKVTGEVDDVTPWLRGCRRAFFMPSREDPFPLAALEAVGSGLPVLCFQGRTGVESIVRASGGLAVDPASEASDDMVDAAVDALRRSDTNDVFWQRARGAAETVGVEMVRAEFSIAAVAADIVGTHLLTLLPPPSSSDEPEAPGPEPVTASLIEAMRADWPCGALALHH